MVLLWYVVTSQIFGFVSDGNYFRIFIKQIEFVFIRCTLILAGMYFFMLINEVDVHEEFANSDPSWKIF